MEPLVPRHRPRPRYPFGFLLAAAAVGIAGWAAQPNRFDENPQAPAVSVAPRQVLAERMAPAVTAQRVASTDGLAVAAPPATGAVMLPPPRPASAPARKRPEENAQANAQASLMTEIAHFKAVLKLTPSQEQYWPPVDAVLREMAREQASAVVAASGRGTGKPKLVIGDEEMSRLASAAFPLLMTLNEDQKRDAMQFARAKGLDRVASAF